MVSPYIKHAVLLGQDRRGLGALIVPDSDALAELAASKGQGVWGLREEKHTKQAVALLVAQKVRQDCLTACAHKVVDSVRSQGGRSQGTTVCKP